MATSPYRSWVEISRSQIAANFQCIQKTVGPEVTVMPVVKADAYRHGAVEVSRVLVREGARWLAVSNVEEGVTLRQSGIEARILVMADFLPVGRVAMLEHGLTPVLHALEDVAELDRLARSRGERVPFHLKVDSGMRRLGTQAGAAEIGDTIRNAQHVELEGLMTHFASVADFTREQTEAQTRYFLTLLEQLAHLGLQPSLIHMSSTGAIAYRRRPAWGNLVRPGHAIYGYVSQGRGAAPGSLLNQVKPALTWKAAVITVKEIPAGSQVGYGGIFKAQEAMRIAVLAAGYADGVPHRLSNRGRVIACGKYASILGAVSMDVTTIDVTHCPGIRTGDSVTLIGREGEASLDAQELARVAGTISYNVLCGISSRVKRVYLD
ncbi:MAG: alanine racemase [Bryobacteraceae bacterium]|nr:alanine racemase [Bryobacteraceae bacterium]